MGSHLTLSDLESRWEKALSATRTAVANHPGTYREVKALAAEIIETPIDINDYFPVVEKLLDHLELLDPCSEGSIFQIFKTRISPSSIWHVKALRMECQELLIHLKAFDEWRCAKHHLRIAK